MPDTGATGWPANTDDLNLPSDATTRAPTSAGDGHYTFLQWLERVTGMLRATATDLLTGMTHDLPMGSHKITGLSDGSATTDAATWGQVQALINGLDWTHPAARVVATSNITLSGTQTIDGVAVIAGDRVLAAGQTTGSQNGVYVVAAGAWARSTDADTSAEVPPGMAIVVNEGTANADTVWILTTNAPITLGTTALTFAELPTPNSLLAGTGLTRTGNTLAVDATVVEELTHKGAASGYMGLDGSSRGAQSPKLHAADHLAAGADPLLGSLAIGESVRVEIYAPPSPVVGTWVKEFQATTSPPDVTNSSNAQNDAATWHFAAQAGTYDLTLLFWSTPNGAIFTIAIDGTTIGTIDSYHAATGLFAIDDSLTGKTISGSGDHTFRITAATRNAGSGGWKLDPVQAILTRRS